MNSTLDNIFAGDPEHAAKVAEKNERFADDVVGKFRNYRAVPGGGFPDKVLKWDVTCAVPSDAQAVYELLGGQPPVERETEAEDALLVATDTNSVPIIISGPDAIRFDMKHWINGKLAHHCNGVTFLSPDEDKGVACGCPKTIAERKERAKNERGPKPDIRLTFRLADDPTLGLFEYKTSGWTLLDDLHSIFKGLDAVGGAALAQLNNEHVEYTTKAGREVSYTKLQVKILKAYEDAITDSPEAGYDEEPPF
ncbi:recombination directionality factor [Kitasatospora purpeofusca]|uniref:recombination directionality factor n=1 Tax=Kitasatospora purpeofusca TaxID=67352 RepID=UPI00368E14B9